VGMLGEETSVQVFVPIKTREPSLWNAEKIGVYDQNTHAGYAKTTPDASKSDKNSYLTYKFTMPETAELFFYMPSNYPREMKMALIERNGSDKTVTWPGNFQGNDTTHIISLGKQNEGANLSMQLQMLADKVYPMITEDFFYYIDMEVFEDVMSRLAEDQMKITEYTGHSFTGTLTTSRENELVLTTIPYDKGWKVTVNGKEVETVKALGSLVAFHIDGAAGETYTIEMVYSPNTLWIGLTISIVCLIILIALIILRKRMMRIKYLRAVVSVPENPDLPRLPEGDSDELPPPDDSPDNT